jgi:hypothetical protein
VILEISPELLSRDPKAGFGIYCDLLTKALLAAPSTIRPSVDENGDSAAFFGTAILKQLDSRVSIQEMYGSDGDDKHSIPWNLTLDLVAMIAIDAFNGGIHNWNQEQKMIARGHIAELQGGKRVLKTPEKDGPMTLPKRQ